MNHNFQIGDLITSDISTQPCVIEHFHKNIVVTRNINDNSTVHHDINDIRMSSHICPLANILYQNNFHLFHTLFLKILEQYPYFKLYQFKMFLTFCYSNVLATGYEKLYQHFKEEKNSGILKDYSIASNEQLRTLSDNEYLCFTTDSFDVQGDSVSFKYDGISKHEMIRPAKMIYFQIQFEKLNLNVSLTDLYYVIKMIVNYEGNNEIKFEW